MKSLSAHLSLAALARVSNVWLLRHEGRSFLVDTGHPLERPALWWALRGLERPAAILLTHRHSDHAGNAAWLRGRLSCPVAASPEDAARLEGRSRPSPPAPGRAAFYQAALNRVEELFPARTPVDELLDGGSERWGFRVSAVPGHTEGSVLLYHQATRTLFSGDSIIVGTPPSRSGRGLRLAYAGFSVDPEESWRTVARFLEEMPPVDWLCSGHGALIGPGADAALRRLARTPPGERVVPAS